MKIKQTIERKILDLVYKDQTKLTITPQDKPDFLIENDVGNKFGVEITQCYTNESDARLKNIPNYTSDLLDNKRYRHKKDIKILKVENIIINKVDGREIKTKAIIQESAKPSEYLEQVKDIINTKTLLKKDYSSDLSHINLIIKDNTDIFSLIKSEEFYNLFFTEEVIRSVTASDFKEIFLITNFKRKTEILRLKLILLSSRIYLFHEIFKSHKSGDITEEKYYQYLAEFLIYEGFKNIRIKKFKEETEIIYSNIGFLVKKFKDLTFRDYGDYQFNDGEIINTTELNFMTEEIQNTVLEIKRTFGFSTNIGQHV